MSSLFENWNIVQILGVGLAGLALLLMVLAYRLLQKIIEEQNPNQAKISLVKWYLGLTITVLIIVGFFSLPILSKNRDLANNNKALDNNVKKLITDSLQLAGDKKALTITNNLNKHFDTLKQATSTIEVSQQLKKIQALTDSLPTAVLHAEPDVKAEAVNIKKAVELEVVNADKKNKTPDTEAYLKDIKMKAAYFKYQINDKIFDRVKSKN